MLVSPVDIITYLGGTRAASEISLSLSFVFSLCISFHLEVIHLETHSLLSLSLSTRHGAAERTYLAHYTCTTAVSS